MVRWRPGPRPKWVEAFNQGRSKRLARIARKPLEPDPLMAEARANTGLSDFGDDAFLEPLELLLAAMEQEANLTLIGRYQVRKMVLRLLENRLKITESLRQDPGIVEEVISRPIFITGMPRTGTSILHEVMAEDPGLRPALTRQESRDSPTFRLVSAVVSWWCWALVKRSPRLRTPALCPEVLRCIRRRVRW